MSGQSIRTWCVRHLNVLLAVALFAATLALFWPAVSCDFVGLDDIPYVSENLMTRNGFSTESLKWAWTTNLLGYWAPLLWMSYMLDGTLFGPEPWGFHFTNILLHAFNAGLVFWLLRRWTGRWWMALGAALMWAWHPLRVESVAWITERKDVLSGLFFLLCLLAYDQSVAGGGRSRVWWWAAVAALAAGLLVKSVLITVPFVLLLLDAWPERRICWGQMEFRQDVLPRVAEKWPFWVVALGLGAAHAWANFAGGDSHAQMPPFLERVLLVPGNYLVYLRQTVWPVRLAVLYNRPVFSGGILTVALGVLGLITLATWTRRRKQPAMLTGWLWFLGMLVPSIGFIWMGTSEGLGDRFAYLPHIGLLILVWSVAEAKLTKMDVAGGYNPKVALAALAATLAALLALLTYRQLGVWRGSETLFARAVAVADRNARAYGSLGVWQAADGKEAEAFLNLRRSLELQPHHNEANFNLANLYLKQERRVEALHHYRIVAADDSKNIKALNNVAWLLASDPDCTPKQAVEALALARRAAAIDEKPDTSVLDTLGLALAANGDFKGAVSAARKALAMVPTDEEGRALYQRIRTRLDAYENGRMWRD